MLSRYSVKKPYTVVVAVVLVIILGVVSFTKMNTDLLPSMNLPYAVVMTTYPGANPETVETVVTKPVEQSMATVSNIENVSSVSRENMSLVILEFAETANMDSATIEMRENLDQISSFWDDSVGKPVIMKMNPDMMPVMVAAVEVKNMKSTEVTDYVTNEIEPDIESIAGVASVSTTGNITESVDVLIQQEKLDQTNQKVKDALLGTFEEKEQDLEDAQQELDDGKKELEDGKEQLESGKEEAASQMGQGASKLNEGQVKILEGKKEIEENLKVLEEKQTELDNGKKDLEKKEEEAQSGLEKLKQSKSALEQLPTAISTMQEKKTELEGQLAQIQAGMDQIQQGLLYDPENEELKAQLAQMQQSQEAITQGITELDGKIEETQGTLNTLLEAFGAADAETALVTVEGQIEEVENGLAQIDAAKEKLKEGQEQLDEGKAKLQVAQAQTETGQEQIYTGIEELNTQQILASVEMSIAGANLDSAASQLEEAQKQLDSGKEQLEDAKEQALDKTNLNNILTSDMVKGILSAENFSMPAGYVTEEGTDYLVRVGDKLQEVDKLQDLVILDLGIDGLAPIRLSDVADVAVHDDSSEVYAILNGNPGVLMAIEKQTGYSTGDVSDKIKERFDRLKEENSDLGVSILMDQGIYIDLVVNSVIDNMLSGAVLAILILFLFLKDIRPTFVIACSIPLSVVAAVVLMYFSGISLNIISLSGLALGIGMLVDNSIVVIENIYRMRNEGIPSRKAAVDGAKQVAGAIAASTLTTVCVFAPIVFTEGITRQLFVDMGLTIAYSLLASLVVALTLVPMMSTGLLKKVKYKKTPLFDKIQNVYAKILRKALKIKPIVLLGAVAFLVISMKAAFAKGTAFMPEMESTQVSMTVSVDKDKTFEDLTKASDQVIAAIQDMEDLESIGAMAGGGGMSSMMGGSSDSVSMYLVLKEDRKLSNEAFEKEILKRTKDIPCEVQVETSSMDMSALGGSGITVQIKGKELDKLQELAQKVGKIVEDVPGTINVFDGMEDTDQEYRIVVDKEKAMEYGLTVAQVFQTVNEHLKEASSATTLSTASKDYDVYVKSDKDEELTRNQINDMKLTYTDKEGKEKKVKLSKIASFENAVSPQSISRDAQSRYMNVTAELETGYNIGLVSDDVEKALKDFELPDGYTMEMKGEDETINEAMGQLVLMLILAVVFMYLIMVAQFQSLLSPFIVMFTIPLAFTGGFLALIAADMEVSVIAMIGFIMLSGIIVNNGIVLVDYINQLRQNGMEKKDAIVEAGRTRLRPIIMTALTTILGLSTLALGMGMGADMIQPMAVVTIGGLLYGTLLTLFVVPCVYDILNRKNYRRDEERLKDEETEESIPVIEG
ncbi:MAG: efflux RND transporter permease subunit [Eubacteriales bacterium]|nr:efflux RND transporter permease subunit [Eubacteriales bacterium]